MLTLQSFLRCVISTYESNNGVGGRLVRVEVCRTLCEGKGQSSLGVPRWNLKEFEES